jgi:methyl-accepting chemotaxis protein
MMGGLKAGLRGKLALMLILFSTLPLLAILAGYFVEIRPRVRALSFSSLQANAVSLGATFNRELVERMKNLEAAVVGHPSALRSENWRKPEGVLANILNADMQAGKFRLMLIVDTKGELLGANNKDLSGQRLPVEQLYGQNFAEEPWFKDVMAGKVTFDAGLLKVTMLPLRREPSVAKVYGDEGWVIPMAGQMRSASGELLGVWVDFLDYTRFEDIIKADVARAALVTEGDMATASVNFDVVDGQNRLLYSYRMPEQGKGRFIGTSVIGKEPDTAVAQLLNGMSNSKPSLVGISDGEALTAVKAPSARGFTADWRIVMRMPVAEAFATANSMTRQIIIALLLTAMAAAGFGALVGTRFSRPILDLAGRMRTLAAGDNEATVPHSGRTDEIGQMAQAVEVFKQGAIDRIRMEHEADEQRGLTEEERARNEKSRAATAKEQAFVVGAIGDGLEHLAKGDLTFRLSTPFPGDYRKLQDDFNAAIGTLQDAMATIAGATEGIRSGTSEISQASEGLSKRTEQQAASLEETAAALDEITATVRKTAEGANHARDVVTNAKSDAERSGEIVGGAVQAMSEIEGSSRQISSIIGVIDEIAFQTNLLALNAGVEAARAGEAGKGFAVVASEVRALAQRSADAAKEIKALIQASSSQVGNGVELVGQAGKALDRIVAQVADISGIVAEIAASAKEQATGLAEVNTAVNQMDQVTQQNAAMVEQSTAASHSLAHEAQELGRLVSRFKLGGSGGVVTPMPKRASAGPKTSPAMKIAGGRGSSAALKPAAAESWDEF